MYEFIDDEELALGINLDIADDSEPEENISVQHVSSQSLALAKCLTLFILNSQVACRISNGAINHLFRFLSIFLVIISSFCTQCSDLAKTKPAE